VSVSSSKIQSILYLTIQILLKIKQLPKIELSMKDVVGQTSRGADFFPRDTN